MDKTWSLIFTSFICSLFVSYPFAQASTLVSPYYRHIFPRSVDHEPVKVLHTLAYKNELISLVTKDGSHQFGIQFKTVVDAQSIVHSTMVQAIERRPFTARRSLSDDGLIFQYWLAYLDSVHDAVLFGYTTDKHVSHVQIKWNDRVKWLELYENRYFFCILNEPQEKPLWAHGVDKDGRVLRAWNGSFDYPVRRTWLSLFVQTYPYIVPRNASTSSNQPLSFAHSPH